MPQFVCVLICVLVSLSAIALFRMLSTYVGEGGGAGADLEIAGPLGDSRRSRCH